MFMGYVSFRIAELKPQNICHQTLEMRELSLSTIRWFSQYIILPLQCHFDVCFLLFPHCCLECVDDFEYGEVMPDGHVSIQIAASRNMRKLIWAFLSLTSDFLNFRKTCRNVCYRTPWKSKQFWFSSFSRRWTFTLATLLCREVKRYSPEN